MKTPMIYTLAALANLVLIAQFGSAVTHGSLTPIHKVPAYYLEQAENFVERTGVVSRVQNWAHTETRVWKQQTALRIARITEQANAIRAEVHGPRTYKEATSLAPTRSARPVLRPPHMETSSLAPSRSIRPVLRPTNR